jgi:hypothetical protein
VHSTKVIGADGTLTEELPAGLRMPLSIYQRRGVLHFLSKGYYFEFKIRPRPGRVARLKIPTWATRLSR